MWELHPIDFDAVRLEPLRVPLRRPLAGVVRVVGDADTPHFPDRLPKLVGEAFRAKQAGHVAKAAGPKCQRVQNRFAQDDFVGLERRPVEQAAMRAGRIQMFDITGLRPPPVEAHDVSR